jgi:hypothetical protein
MKSRIPFKVIVATSILSALWGISGCDKGQAPASPRSGESTDQAAAMPWQDPTYKI